MSKLTVNDIRNYLIKIQVNFENAYKFETNDEFKLLLASWNDILSKYPKEICDLAVNNAISKAKFAPRIGDITEEIDKLLQAENSKSDVELWAEIMDVKREVYDTSLYLRYPQHFEPAQNKLNEIYNGLSEELKLYIVNVSSLVEICSLSEENMPYEKSQFFRKMPELKNKFNDKTNSVKLLQMIDKKLIGNEKHSK